MHLFRVTYAFLIAAGYHTLVVVTEEPACSRFHYEEKFMEKVIRLEIKLEQFIREMKGRMADSEHRAAVAKEEVNESVKELNESVTKLVDEKMENYLHKTGVTSSIPTIAFNARQKVSASLATNDVLVFDIVIENKHEGYDSETGIFTAPQSGLYYFSAHICVDSNKGGGNFAIVVNNERLAVSSLYTSKGKNSCSSVSAVAMMTSNEKAFVKILHASFVMNSIEYRWSSFVGALLR